MKKTTTILLCVLTLISIIPIASRGVEPGDGNIDGGGGSMGEATAENRWSAGNDGVRITIVDAISGVAMTEPIDYTNRNQSDALLHFGKVNKIQYRTGTPLSIQTGGGYRCKSPEYAMPMIVSNGGHNNIEAIKRYFCGEYAVMMIASDSGFDYARLLSGDYKLLLEPIAYFTFNSQQYCMSATEAAMYDQLASGALHSKLPSLTHQNLPLAMFLEYSDLGFVAWDGATTGRQTNTDIINSLGLGIVRFAERIVDGGVSAPDVEYRVDTDVITSVTLSSNANLTPDNPASVTFSINGVSYIVNNIMIPAGDSQVVWVKWRTPVTPGDVAIYVSVSGAFTARNTINARIVDLSEIKPPDPLATDTNPGYTIPALPSITQKMTASWSVWRCYWVPVWVWHSYFSGGGYWCNHGYWAYAYDSFFASVSGSMSLSPDDNAPVSALKNIKSGYGVKTNVSATLSTSAPLSHYTYPQTAFSTFPEFRYETYQRLLRRESGGLSVRFSFEPNPFSTYANATHFTPVWFPDGAKYEVYSQVWDAWTPDGMLSVNLSDYVLIQGSLFDDWYTNRE